MRAAIENCLIHRIRFDVVRKSVFNGPRSGNVNTRVIETGYVFHPGFGLWFCASVSEHQHILER